MTNKNKLVVRFGTHDWELLHKIQKEEGGTLEAIIKRAINVYYKDRISAINIEPYHSLDWGWE